MAENNTPSSDRIDINDKAACESWAHKLNVTHEQMREAIDAVGSDASEVEKHLKGVRSTTNEEKMERSGGSEGKPA
jgi:hypothetical protein